MECPYIFSFSSLNFSGRPVSFPHITIRSVSMILAKVLKLASALSLLNECVSRES